MPGAQDRWDQLTEPGAATQGDRPHASDRPERGSVAELRVRLERLPPATRRPRITTTTPASRRLPG